MVMEKNFPSTSAVNYAEASPLVPGPIRSRLGLITSRIFRRAQDDGNLVFNVSEIERAAYPLEDGNDYLIVIEAQQFVPRQGERQSTASRESPNDIDKLEMLDHEELVEIRNLCSVVMSVCNIRPKPLSMVVFPGLGCEH